jgi:hypothetical protein
MAMKKRIVYLEIRETLEYAEARKLFIEKSRLQRYLDLLESEIKSVRRVSPQAVEQAKRDLFNRGEEKEPTMNEHSA